MVKSVVKDSVFGARVFYTVLGVFMLLIFLLYDNDLLLALKNGDIIYITTFFLLVIASYYLFLTCGDNPGYMDIHQEQTNNEIVIQIGEIDAGTSHNELDDPVLQNKSFNSNLIDKKNQIENNQESQMLPKNDKVSSPSIEQRHFCDICNIYQPIRTKHCELCEKCVHKYDHHCFWIGSCVGELNHRKFWLFLFFQSILHIWCFIIGISGLDIYSVVPTYNNSSNSNSSQDLPPNYSQEYGAFMICCIINFLLIIFCVIKLFNTSI